MFLTLILACTESTPKDPPPLTPETDTPTGTETGTPASPLVAVSSYFAGTVTLYDRATAAIVGVLDAPGAQTVAVAPDGSWIVCAEEVNEVRRFDPADLATWDVLIAEDPTTTALEGGGLAGPTAAAFGPDGRLYVSSFDDDRVLRFEPDGTFVDTFVQAADGALDGPDISLAWDADGDLYVPSWYGDAVLRYDGATGAFVEAVLAGADGLAAPRVLAFDPSGTLWVTSNGSDGVLRRFPDGTVDLFTEVRGAAGMALEDGGSVLIASAATDSVRVYDQATGETTGLFTNDDSIDGVTAVTLLSR